MKTVAAEFFSLVKVRTSFPLSKMGISAALETSAGVSTALNLFALLTLPLGPDEINQEIVNTNQHLHVRFVLRFSTVLRFGAF